MFTSWGLETPRVFTREQIEACLKELGNSEKYGTVLRAKGIVAGSDGQWIHFDYVPDAPDVRTGPAGIIGRLCVIGAELKEDAIALLFNGQE